MDILMIGGTTFFGRDIVELALEAGHYVTVFSRGNQKPAFWNHIKHIKGDRHIHNLAYRRDVARGYIAAMSSEKAVNQVYNFAQNEMFRVLDWVSLAADLLEVKTDIVSISAELLQQCGFVYSEPWSHTGTFILDTSRARTDLGYLSTPVGTWMTTTTEWYREQGEWKNSLEDSERQAEIAFVQKYRRLIVQL